MTEKYPSTSDLTVLHQAIHSCRLCEGLPEIATPKVYGNAAARIVVIGQALSLAESIAPEARPFDDTTGRTLRRWLDVSEESFYDPELFYLTALGKCYPGKAARGGDLPPRRHCYEGDGQGGGNWLYQELALLHPRLILTLGARALHFCLPAEHEFTPCVGRCFSWQGTPLLPLPHPSGANRFWHVRHAEQLEACISLAQRLVHEALL